MRKLLITGLLSFLSFQSVAAGRVVDAKVISIRVDLSGKAMVMFNKTVESSPDCVNPAYGNALAFDASTAGGKAILSLVISAKAIRSDITVYGAGTCGLFGGSNVETWNYGVSS